MPSSPFSIICIYSIWIPIIPPALIHLKCIGIKFFFHDCSPCNSTINNSKISSDDIFSILCKLWKLMQWKNPSRKWQLHCCIYLYLKTNKCQKNLLALYVHVGFKNKWTTGFYSKYPATEGNLPIRVLKYKCQMQLKMHSDRSGSQNLEFGFFGSPMELRVYGKLNKGFSKKIGQNLYWFFYNF